MYLIYLNFYQITDSHFKTVDGKMFKVKKYINTDEGDEQNHVSGSPNMKSRELVQQNSNLQCIYYNNALHELILFILIF